MARANTKLCLTAYWIYFKNKKRGEMNCTPIHSTFLPPSSLPHPVTVCLSQSQCDCSLWPQIKTQSIEDKSRDPLVPMLQEGSPRCFIIHKMSFTIFFLRGYLNLFSAVLQIMESYPSQKYVFRKVSPFPRSARTFKILRSLKILLQAQCQL